MEVFWAVSPHKTGPYWFKTEAHRSLWIVAWNGAPLDERQIDPEYVTFVKALVEAAP